jgi:AraC-like DNA-binding protein
MDPLDDVFSAMRVESSIYARLVTGPRWAIRFAAGKSARFGLVVDGECWLTTEKPRKSVQLRKGDCYILVQGTCYVLGDHPQSVARNCFDVIGDKAGGIVDLCEGQPPSATIVTGWFTFDELGARPLVSLMPQFLHTRVDGNRTEILKSTLELLSKETEQPGIGSGTVISRLADILFVQAIRSHLADSGEEDVGWLTALADPRLGAALRLIHVEPQTSWTVDRLASEAGMSRSAFASRFKNRVGEAPVEYLIRWRMFRAGILLRRTDLSISEIATQVGYESDAALSKAFRRITGVAPSAFRKGRREGSANEPRLVA